MEGYIQADASATLGDDTVTESGWFRYLQAGVDYFVHPSGLWIALRSPLRRDEMLAVTYVTAAGDTIGDYNPERIHNEGGRPRLSLLRASEPNHQPGRPTWDLEMHQVYRVSGSNDVEIPSVSLDISVGELSAGRTFTRGLAGEDITYLKLLGLDEESPVDVIDRAYVYKPAADDFEEQPAVSGTFIIFPTLRPFAEPPPIYSLGLSAEETSEILAGDANPEIYDAVDPYERGERRALLAHHSLPRAQRGTHLVLLAGRAGHPRRQRAPLLRRPRARSAHRLRHRLRHGAGAAARRGDPLRQRPAGGPARHLGATGALSDRSDLGLRHERQHCPRGMRANSTSSGCTSARGDFCAGPSLASSRLRSCWAA